MDASEVLAEDPYQVMQQSEGPMATVAWEPPGVVDSWRDNGGVEVSGYSDEMMTPEDFALPPRLAWGDKHRSAIEAAIQADLRPEEECLIVDWPPVPSLWTPGFTPAPALPCEEHEVPDSACQWCETRDPGDVEYAEFRWNVEVIIEETLDGGEVVELDRRRELILTTKMHPAAVEYTL